MGTTVVVILSMVKKTPFTTSSQVKKTLLVVGVSVNIYNQEKTSREQIWRVHTRCKQGHIRLCQKTSKKARPTNNVTSRKVFFGWLKLRSTCTRMMGRKKYGECLEQLMKQSIQQSVKHEAVWCMSCMAFSGTRLLVFSDDVTEPAGRILKCIGIYSLPRFRQMQLIGGHFILQMDNDPKHTAKATHEFLKVKTSYILQ